MSKKNKSIRLFVTIMVEIGVDGNIDTEEAIKEFQTETVYEFKDTANVKVIDTEIRDFQKISVLEYSENNFLLKPLKNEPQDNGNRINSSREKGTNREAQQDSGVGCS